MHLSDNNISDGRTLLLDTENSQYYPRPNGELLIKEQLAKRLGCLLQDSYQSCLQ